MDFRTICQDPSLRGGWKKVVTAKKKETDFCRAMFRAERLRGTKGGGRLMQEKLCCL